MEVAVSTMGFKFLTSLLFVVTEEVDAEKNEINKKKKSEKSPGCNFGKGCGNNLKLIGGRTEKFLLSTAYNLAVERGVERHYSIQN